MAIWNPWHGCHKISPGCAHCYMYRRDAEYNKNSSIVTKTNAFRLPLAKHRDGSYQIPGGETVYTCMTSDFFVEEADDWRMKTWECMHIRRDLHFVIITKRIERFRVVLPFNWGDGYGNVTIASTCENQEMADARLPIMLDMPIKHRRIVHEPMLERINIENYLSTGQFENVLCGGESGPDARICDYAWVLDIRAQCKRHGVSFHFKQTGARFRMNGRIYHVPRRMQLEQAAKARIDLG